MSFLDQKGFVPVAIFFIGLFAMGAGTLATAQNSLPGSALYGLKTTVESVQVSLAIGQKNKAGLHMEIANEKLDEIQRMQTKKFEAKKINQATHIYIANEEAAIATIQNLDAQGKNSVANNEKLESNLLHQQGILEDVLSEVPDEAKIGIQNALNVSKGGLEKAFQMKGKK